MVKSEHTEFTTKGESRFFQEEGFVLPVEGNVAGMLNYVERSLTGNSAAGDFAENLNQARKDGNIGGEELDQLAWQLEDLTDQGKVEIPVEEKIDVGGGSTGPGFFTESYFPGLVFNLDVTRNSQGSLLLDGKLLTAYLLAKWMETRNIDADNVGSIVSMMGVLDMSKNLNLLDEWRLVVSDVVGVERVAKNNSLAPELGYRFLELYMQSSYDARGVDKVFEAYLEVCRFLKVGAEDEDSLVWFTEAFLTSGRPKIRTIGGKYNILVFPSQDATFRRRNADVMTIEVFDLDKVKAGAPDEEQKVYEVKVRVAGKEEQLSATEEVKATETPKGGEHGSTPSPQLPVDERKKPLPLTLPAVIAASGAAVWGLLIWREARMSGIARNLVKKLQDPDVGGLVKGDIESDLPRDPWIKMKRERVAVVERYLNDEIRVEQLETLLFGPPRG